MKRSTDRIVTTHTGSLPRGGEIVEMLVAREKGEDFDPDKFGQLSLQAVEDVVDRQLAVGLDVINDGEQTKPSYATYIIDRVSGDGDKRRKRYPKLRDVADFPE